MISSEETRYLIALSRVPEIGTVTAGKLHSRFGSYKAVFDASAKELIQLGGVTERRSASIKSFDGWDALDREAELLKEQGIRTLTVHSDGYPENMKVLHSPPLVVYVKGDILREDRFAVAIVGSRAASDYGLAVADKLASELCAVGFTIISGLARGVDSSAHIGAIKRNGRTGAILGSGILVPYPSENKGLMERISKCGFVMSEFTPTAQPARENFPMRNRIISALSLGVIVVEAAEGSGALITARHALEQGKEVFAVPGNILSAGSKGPHDLIRDGARLLTSVDDIIAELAPKLKGFIKSKEQVKIELTADEQALASALSVQPEHIDDVSRSVGWLSSKTLSVMLGLELKGLVRQAGGKRFHLI